MNSDDSGSDDGLLFGGFSEGLADAHSDDDDDEEDKGFETAEGKDLRVAPMDAAFQRLFKASTLEVNGDDNVVSTHDAAPQTHRKPPSAGDAADIASATLSTATATAAAAKNLIAVDERPVPDDSISRDMAMLFGMIRAKGGFIHPSLRLGRFQREGVGGFLDHESEGASTGDLLLRIPSDCIIFADNESIVGLDTAFKPANLQAADMRQMVLAFALWQEASRGSGSDLYAYFATLPEDLSNFPVTWNPSAAKILTTASVAVRQQLPAQAAALKTEYDHLSKCSEAGVEIGTKFPCSFAEYIRAKLMVCSRCFKIGEEDAFVMLPLLDMLNHTKHPHVRLHKAQGEGGGAKNTSVNASSDIGAADGSSLGFELRLCRRIEAGTQIFNTYGHRPAVSWLLNYGFVPDECFDDAAEVEFEVNRIDLSSESFFTSNSSTSNESSPKHKFRIIRQRRHTSDTAREISTEAGAPGDFKIKIEMVKGERRESSIDPQEVLETVSPEYHRLLLTTALRNHSESITALTALGSFTGGGVRLLESEVRLLREAQELLSENIEAGP